MRLWKANSIRKRRGRFTVVIKNRFHIKRSSGTSVPPSSNDNCAANKNTESPTMHKCTQSLGQGLFYISIHRVATLLPILLVKRGQLVPPHGRSCCFAICRQKNLDASPATDPAANKWRNEKWPPRRRTRQTTPVFVRFMSPTCRPWLSNVERWLIVCKPREANHPWVSELLPCLSQGQGSR